nr:immunoglobulin light chain junction region [Macaca mulatta]MOX98098.1 immunoglobulin light chain junction region [Macaca mulatta]MOX98412.1 immunoglobulin light chain junction region [Macaca mulatta]MOX98607.1 immunoglobulin light chain junction region [Macaca mulatta]MOX98723.1 immunoglobulin light chain junction region [Macaca mulatta]
CLQYKTFPLTF